MALNFPSLPNEGDVHVDPDSGQSWTFVEGAWVYTSAAAAEQQIVDADAENGYFLGVQNWQVVGDVLVLYGYSAANAHPEPITFNKTFKVAPSVTITAVNASPRFYTIQNLTVSGFDAHGWNDAGGTAQPSFYWVAIGEALDADKQAKSVFGGAGGGSGGASITIGDTFPVDPSEGALHYLTTSPSGLFVWISDGSSDQWVQANGGSTVPATTEAFHDPTGVASWRIDKVTNTLECWGRITGGVHPTPVVFPKEFASPPVVNTAMQNLSETRTATIDDPTTTGFNFYRWSLSGTGTTGATGHWSAIGEWSGD